MSTIWYSLLSFHPPNFLLTTSLISRNRPRDGSDGLAVMPTTSFLTFLWATMAPRYLAYSNPEQELVCA